MYNTIILLQVQYNPGNPRRTTIPQPSGSRTGPPPPIPEELRPQGAHNSPASNHSGGDKEKLVNLLQFLFPVLLITSVRLLKVLSLVHQKLLFSSSDQKVYVKYCHQFASVVVISIV